MRMEQANRHTYQKTEGYVAAAIFAGMLLVAMDQTIVVTALPSILAELGGMEYFTWVFSAYMIAELTCMPIFGKLADRYGRKRFFLLGLSLFMLGSLLCGMAASMPTLVLARFVQGLGGGAVIPIAFTIIFNLFPLDKRYLMQGLLAAVFGLSSILGPGLGALLSDHLNWRWIFWINLPLGVIAIALIVTYYKEALKRKGGKRIDVAGMLWLSLALLSLMLFIELIGKQPSMPMGLISALLACFVVAAAVLVFIEKQADDPVIPFFLFRKKRFFFSQINGFLMGAVMIAVIAFIPLYIQGVHAESAMAAGKVITPMMLGVVAGSTVGGQLVEKISYRSTALLATGLAWIALSLMATMTQLTDRVTIIIYVVLLGCGIGVSFPALMASSLHGITPEMHGSVNSLVIFFRNLGAAAGVLIFGIIQFSELKNSFDFNAGSGSQLSDIADFHRFFQAETRELISADQRGVFVTALGDSVVHVFKYAAGLCLAMLAFIPAMGKAKLDIEKLKHLKTLPGGTAGDLALSERKFTDKQT